MRVCFAPAAIAASLLVASCKDTDTTVIPLDDVGTAGEPAPPVPGLFTGAVVSVPASAVLSGFKHGQLRKRIEVASFSISKHPITWGQYAECVDAESCREPQQECANAGGAEQDAALCVGEENAREYCAWVGGGRLPSLEEWLLAARGVSPQRFAWGDDSATCEQHALAVDASRRGLSEGAVAAQVLAETECGEPLSQRYEVAKHSAGASALGVEDVLIARGELLGGEAGSHFTACARSGRSCMVYGLFPGAIDAVKLVDEAGGAAGAEAYTFRCVWSGEGS